MAAKKPSIAEEDLKVSPRVAKSAAKVAGRSLKVKATKKETQRDPDKYCKTLPNGDCVSDNPRCMHQPKTTASNTEQNDGVILREDGSVYRHKTPQDYDRPALEGVAIIDLATGEQFQGYHPAELVLVDDLERYRYSHSFIESAAACKAKAHFYRMHAPARRVFSMERGTVAHILLEDLQKNPKLDIEKRFDELWNQQILDKYKDFDDDDKASIKAGEREITFWMIEDWVGENLDLVNIGRIRPEDVEVEFTLPIEFTTPKGKFKRMFNGKLDLVLWNEKRTEYQIFDYKTSVNVPSEEELGLKPQFTLYQYAATQLFGKPPIKMWWYHLRGKHKTPGEHEPPLTVKTGPNKGQLLQKTPSFNEEKHPRVPECLNFAYEVPLRTQRDMDDYFNNLCAGIIIAYESGDMTKTGLADPKNNCLRCQYSEHCKKTDISLPFHVRIPNDDAV